MFYCANVIFLFVFMYGAVFGDMPFANDKVLLAEKERMLQRIVYEFGRECKRRKVNVGRSKIMVFKRVREHNIESAKSYRVRAEREQ